MQTKQTLARGYEMVARLPGGKTRYGMILSVTDDTVVYRAWNRERYTCASHEVLNTWEPETEDA